MKYVKNHLDKLLVPKQVSSNSCHKRISLVLLFQANPAWNFVETSHFGLIHADTSSKGHN